MNKGKDAKNNADGGKGHGMRSITLQLLERLCDDPARDKPGGLNVRALLTFEPESGFHLMARDGDTIYQVNEEAGEEIRFRTSNPLWRCCRASL